MKSEAEIQAEIQLEAPKLGVILERNNSGAFTDATGRHVRYGLGNVSRQHNEQIKSSDLIGITTIIVTPDMVGKTIGVFTAVEVKSPDWNPSKKLDKRETAQARYISWVRSRGGFAGFANSLDSFRNILKF